MLELDANEQHLLDLLQSPSLGACAQGLRQACFEIWGTGTGFLVPFFTGHGLDHSRRVLGNLRSLVTEPGTGRVLVNPDELFVCIAAAYLHDIGMQADIRKRPEVRAAAEARGARFKTGFDSGDDGPLTDEQVDDLRRNHAAMSAAWIGVLRQRALEANVGVQVQSIPPQYLSDIQNVCQFHSKADLSACPRTFKIIPNCRLRLCAALVRMADEMDTDRRRVDVNAATVLSMPAFNAVHWYLAARTFSSLSGHELTLTVALSPDDHRRFSALVQEELIDGFVSKNRPVTDVLDDAGIRVRVTRESQCVEDEYHDDLPAEVRRHLETLGHQLAPENLRGATPSPAAPPTERKQADESSVRKKTALRLASRACDEREAGNHQGAKTLMQEAYNLGLGSSRMLIGYARIVAASEVNLDEDPIFATKDQREVAAAAYALALALRGDASAARRVVSKLDAVETKSLTLLSIVAEAYSVLGLRGKEQAVRKRLYDEDRNPVNAYNLGMAHWGLGHYRRAAALVDEFLAAKPEDVEALAARGHLALRLSEDVKARESFIAASRSGPTASEALDIADGLEQLGEYGSALDILDEIGSTSSDPAVFITRSRVRRYLRQLNGAVSDIERSLQLGADAVASHTALGNTYWELGRLDDAEAAYLAAIAASEDAMSSRCSAACRLAELLVERGAHTDALKLLDKVIANDIECKGCYIGYRTRSVAHAHLGHPRLAKSDFEAALAIRAQQGVATDTIWEEDLGDFYLSVLNDPARALSHYTAVAKQEDLSELIRGKAYAGISSCLSALGREVEAAAAAARAADLAPGNPAVVLQAGRTHFLAGEYERAVSYFESAAELHGSAYNLLHVCFGFCCLHDGSRVLGAACDALPLVGSIEEKAVALWYRTVGFGLIGEPIDESAQELRDLQATVDGPVLALWDLSYTYERLRVSPMPEPLVAELVALADALASG